MRTCCVALGTMLTALGWPATGMRSCFSRVRPFVTLWTVAHQAPLSMGFSRQGYWSGLPCPPPGALPSQGRPFGDLHGKEIQKREAVCVYDWFTLLSSRNWHITEQLSSQVARVVKNLPANAGDIRDAGSTPGLGRSPGGGCSNPFQ